jgi:hypothetical protein
MFKNNKKNARMLGEKFVSLSCIGILPSGIDIPASGQSPVPLVTD